MVDRRRERRRRCLVGGRASFGHRQSPLDCVVRNISTAGAMLSFRPATVLPTEFEVHIPRWSASFRGRMIWRSSERVGVVLSELAPVTISLDEVRRMKALQKENKQLRALLYPPS